MVPLKRPNIATSKVLRRRSHSSHSEVYSDVTEALGLLQKTKQTPTTENPLVVCRNQTQSTSSHFIYLKIIFNIIPRSTSNYPQHLLLLIFLIKILYTFLISPVHATKITFRKQSNLRSSTSGKVPQHFLFIPE